MITVRAALTMAQIARELGLSRRSVSSVVNGRARERGISAATAERVREYLKKRGYVPSRHARNLRAPRQDAIGLLYDGHLYSHIHKAFDQLVEVLSRNPESFELMVLRGRMLEGMREMVARGVSKVVWIHGGRHSRALEQHDGLLEYLTGFGTTVLYNYRFGEDTSDKTLTKAGLYLVGADRGAGFLELGRRLFALGHRRVIIPNHEANARGMSALPALEQAGLTCICDVPSEVGRRPTQTYGEQLARYLSPQITENRASAVCFLDDELAGYAIAEWLRLGRRIPEDFSVTGFDGMEFAAAFGVPMTTVEVPVNAMVDRIQRILKKPPARKRHSFKPNIIERESHGPAPKT